MRRTIGSIAGVIGVSAVAALSGALSATASPTSSYHGDASYTKARIRAALGVTE